MFAQRFTGQPTQVVHFFRAGSTSGLTNQINDYVRKYHARIVCMSTYTAHDWHTALVTFEPEPVE